MNKHIVNSILIITASFVLSILTIPYIENFKNSKEEYNFYSKEPIEIKTYGLIGEGESYAKFLKKYNILVKKSSLDNADIAVLKVSLNFINLKKIKEHFYFLNGSFDSLFLIRKDLKDKKAALAVLQEQLNNKFNMPSINKFLEDYQNKEILSIFSKINYPYTKEDIKHMKVFKEDLEHFKKQKNLGILVIQTLVSLIIFYLFLLQLNYTLTNKEITEDLFFLGLALSVTIMFIY